MNKCFCSTLSSVNAHTEMNTPWIAHHFTRFILFLGLICVSVWGLLLGGGGMLITVFILVKLELYVDVVLIPYLPWIVYRAFLWSGEARAFMKWNKAHDNIHKRETRLISVTLQIRNPINVGFTLKIWLWFRVWKHCSEHLKRNNTWYNLFLLTNKHDDYWLWINSCPFHCCHLKISIFSVELFYIWENIALI